MTSSLTSQEEIQRLNSIISVLLEQVAALKRENAALKSNDGTNNKFYTNEGFTEVAKTKFYTIEQDKGGVNNKIYTNEGFTEGAKTKFYTSEEDKGGVNNKIYTNEGFTEGAKTKIYTSNEVKEGVNNIFYTSDEDKEGTNSKFYTSEEVNDSINNKFYTCEEVTDGIKIKKDASVNEKLPPIEISETNVTALSDKLKDTMPDGTTRQTCKTVARELLFLYNNGFANGHELRKAANLSLSGFSKHFPLLKRRNFIYKHGVKKYALTPFARGIINNTFGTP